MAAILNWLWQGGIIALAAAAVLKGLAHAPAPARHLVSWAALLSVLAAPAAFFLAGAATASPPSGAAAAYATPLVHVPERWWTSLEIVLALWAAWTCAHAVRLAGTVPLLRRAVRTSRPVSPRRQARLAHWHRLRRSGRRARLVVSDHVQSAGVLGTGSAVIALAPSLLEHLRDDELDRVVLHEWAHVQRGDDAGNVVLLCVEALVGWHPAVWWAGRRIRLERELACDETVVSLTGSARQYAACLLRVADLRRAAAPGLPILAAVGSGALRRRLVHLLSRPHPRHRRVWRAAALGGSALLAALAPAAGRLHPIDSARQPSAASAGTPGAATTAPAPAVEPAAGTAAPDVRTRLAPAAELDRRAMPERRRSTSDATPERPRTQSRPGPDVNTPWFPAEVEPLALVAREPHTGLAARLAALVPPPRTTSHGPAGPGGDTDRRWSRPWRRATGAGVAVGRGARSAADATAGFFGRLGSRLGGAF